MTTEYRRGIPRTAHVEAATRLGLLWWAENNDEDYWRFGVVSGEVHSTYDNRLHTVTTGRLSPCFDEERIASFRPIRPDGTPVDWEVLDQEVARVGQQGQPATITPTVPTAPTTQPQGFRADLWSRICIHFGAYVLNRFNVSVSDGSVSEVAIDDASQGLVVRGRLWNWPNTTFAQTPRQRADILIRWTVYQELKPLYDLVDGAQGEAAMPRDVEAEWDRQSLGSAYNYETDGDWVFGRDSLGIFARSAESVVWRAGPSGSQVPLRNFAAVLDAVAERRVTERMRGQRQGQTQDTIPINPEHDALVASRLSQRARSGRTVTSTQPAQPEPRRFTDVRPDRHGWRWWRQTGRDSTDLGQRFETQDGRCRWRSAHAEAWFAPDTANPQMLRYTVIPTDEQGNPVSWESVGQTVGVGQTTFNDEPVLTEPWPVAGTVQSVNSDGTVTVRLNGDGSVSPARDAATENEVQRVTQEVSRVVAQASQQILGTNVTVSPTGRVEPGQFSNDFTASTPITAESFARVLIQLDRGQNSVNAAQLHADTIRYCEQQISQAIIGGDMPAPSPRQEAKRISFSNVHQIPETPLPRFTADELDDVDHSKTTKQDYVTLKRGRKPVTLRMVQEYRKSRGTNTEIDSEIALYVLQRWCQGLGDEEALNLMSRLGGQPHHGTDEIPKAVIDEIAMTLLSKHRPPLDTSEKPSPTVQRERQEAEERRQRLARLSEQLRTERAANVETNEAEPNRFDLLEPDPTVDPAESIRAWETRRAAVAAASRKVGQEVRQPVTQPKWAEKPPAPKPRPAILVVDAEKDGLTWGEAGLALLGLKLNEAC